MVVPDGLWIQALNVNGLVGITSLLLVFLVPVYLLGRKVAPSIQMRSPLGLVSVMALVVALYMLALDVAVRRGVMSHDEAAAR